jgi:hypothetical protein
VPSKAKAPTKSWQKPCKNCGKRFHHPAGLASHEKGCVREAEVARSATQGARVFMFKSFSMLVCVCVCVCVSVCVCVWRTRLG